MNIKYIFIDFHHENREYNFSFVHETLCIVMKKIPLCSLKQKYYKQTF